MNKRWITFLGRIGAVLVVIGLSLVLLSLLPAREVEYSDFSGTSVLTPRTFSIEYVAYLSNPLDPQHGLYLKAQANHSAAAFLLGVSTEYVYQWMTSHFPGIEPSPTYNVSIFEEFLKNNPQSVVWQENTVEVIEFQYSPPRVMNLTIVFSNPTTESTKVKYDGKLVNFIVPNERALNPAKFIIPIGFVLAAPWLNLTLKQKKKQIR